MKNFINLWKQTSKACLIGFLVFYFSIFSLKLAALEQDQSDKMESEHPKKGEGEISNWQARLELARVLSYLKKYDESLREYQILLQERPDSLIARMEMAKVLFYQGKTDEALTEMAKIPPQKLDDASWLILADIYRKKKNYGEAEKIYAEHLNKFPQDDKIRLSLAELLSWQKRYEESIHQYRLILSRHPEDIQVRRKYAQVLTWAGEDEEAIKEWKKTLQ